MKHWLPAYYPLLLLFCELGAPQTPVKAADPSPFLFNFSQDYTFEKVDASYSIGNIRLRCPKETLSGSTHKSSSSIPILRTVLIKDAKEYSVDSIQYYHNVVGWMTKNFTEYFQCGRAVNFQKLQKGINEMNSVVLKKSGGANSVFDETVYSLTPTISRDGVLSLEVVGKVIQNIQISTRCNEQGRTIDTSGTIALRGQKPDALIRRTLGLGIGDRYPISVRELGEILDRVFRLGLFEQVWLGIAIDHNSDNFTWLICVNQKDETQIMMDEAARIDVQNAESAKWAINKYEEALALFKKPKAAARHGESKQFLIMHIVESMATTLPTQKEAIIRIADIYAEVGEFYQALHYYSQALPITQEKDKREEARVLTEIADIYRVLGDRQQAQKYYQQALSLRLKYLNQQK